MIYIGIYPQKSKACLETCTSMELCLSKQLGIKPSAVQTDNGEEFSNELLRY